MQIEDVSFFNNYLAMMWGVVLFVIVVYATIFMLLGGRPSLSNPKPEKRKSIGSFVLGISENQPIPPDVRVNISEITQTEKGTGTVHRFWSFSGAGENFVFPVGFSSNEKILIVIEKSRHFERILEFQGTIVGEARSTGGRVFLVDTQIINVNGHPAEVFVGFGIFIKKEDANEMVPASPKIPTTSPWFHRGRNGIALLSRTLSQA